VYGLSRQQEHNDLEDPKLTPCLRVAKDAIERTRTRKGWAGGELLVMAEHVYVPEGTQYSCGTVQREVSLRLWTVVRLHRHHHDNKCPNWDTKPTTVVHVAVAQRSNVAKGMGG
jgi:hypothetical protein